MSYSELELLNSVHLALEKMGRRDLSLMIDAIISYESSITAQGHQKATIPISVIPSIGRQAPISSIYRNRLKSRMSSYLTVSQEYYGCENAETVPQFREEDSEEYENTKISEDGIAESSYSSIKNDNGTFKYHEIE